MTKTDWNNITDYIDTVGTTLKTFTFPKTQNFVSVTLRGNANVTYSIGSQTGTLTPGQSISVSEKITSFTLTAVSGTQNVEVWATEDGTEKIEDNGVSLDDVVASLAESASDISSRGVNVKTPFGTSLTPAKGDGTTNDSTAIQSIINYVSGLGGGIVVIPKGTFIIDTTLQIPSNITLNGMGKDVTILKAKNAFTTGSTGIGVVSISDNAQRVNINHLTIDGNKASNAQTGLMCLTSPSTISYLTLEHVKLTNSSWHGLNLNGNYLKVDSCDFINTGESGGGNSNGAGCFGIGNFVKFLNCKFDTVWQHGVYSEFTNLVIDNCTFSTTLSIDTNNPSGIPGVGISLRYGDNIITNNKIDNFYYGIELVQNYSHQDRILIEHNIITNPLMFGISGGCDVDHLRIENNLISATTQRARGINIHESGSGTAKPIINFVAKNNTIDNFQYGVYFCPDACNNAEIADNFLTSGIPFYVDKNAANTNLTGKGLYLRGNKTLSSDSYSTITGAVTLDNIIGEGNSVINSSGTFTSTTTINDLSTTTYKFVEQWKIKKTITVTIGTVPAQSSVDITYTDPYFVVGLGTDVTLTAVALSGAIPAGLVWNVISSNTNSKQLFIRFANVTTAPITVSGTTSFKLMVSR